MANIAPDILKETTQTMRTIMIIKKRNCIWFVILIIAVMSAGAVAQAEVKEGDLIAVLKSNAPK